MTSEERLEQVLKLWRLTWSPQLSALALKLEVEAAPLSDEGPTQQVARAKYLAQLAADSTDLNRAAVLAACRVFAANALHGNLVPAIICWVDVQPDPRVAAFAFELLSRPGAMREVTHALAAALLEVIATHGDKSTIALVEQWMQGAGVHRTWRGTGRRVMRTLGARKVLPVDEKKFAALSEGVTGARAPAVKAIDGSALLDAIYAAPHDDAPRLAWADWLTEAGDPLGEFIVLQVSHARGRVPKDALKREKTLLSQVRARLLGELASCVALSSVKFSRGFLARAEFNWNEIPPARELELLEEFTLGRTATGRLPPKVTWRALRRASRVGAPAAPALLQSAPVLEELVVGAQTWAAYEAMLALARPTKLRVLSMGVVMPIIDRWPVLLASPIFHGLELLELRMHGTQWSRDPKTLPIAVMAASALTSLPASIAEFRVELVEVPVLVRYLRREGRFSTVRIEFDEKSSMLRAAHAANAVLLGMAADPLAVLEVHGPKKFDVAEFEQLITRTRSGTKELRCTWDD